MRPRARNQVVGITLFTALAGVVTAMAAQAGVGPFADLPGHAASVTVAAGPLATDSPRPVRADELFPPAAAPTPREQTVYVQDPAPPPIVIQPPAATPPKAASSTPEPTEPAEAEAPTAGAPTAAPAASPSARPCDDDCGEHGSPSLSPSPSASPGPDD